MIIQATELQRELFLSFFFSFFALNIQLISPHKSAKYQFGHIST